MTAASEVVRDGDRGRERIAVHVPRVEQLFNAIDPSPLREKDLDARVEAFIVSWAREAHHRAQLELVVHVDEPERDQGGTEMVRNAVRVFFSERSRSKLRELRQLFRVGRTSLAVGLLALTVTAIIGGTLERVLSDQGLGAIVRDSLVIGGWVAMWRPLEIFLYDWWPMRDDVRLFDRLSAMPVRIEHDRRPGT